MAKRSIQELKNEFQRLKSNIPWDEIKENEIYHIPPIVSLERRDLFIISKTDESATYKRVDISAQDERVMHKTSVFAKFLVKEKEY